MRRNAFIVGIVAAGVTSGVIGGVVWSDESRAIPPEPSSVQLDEPNSSPRSQVIVSRVDWPILDALLKGVDVVVVVEWQGDRDEVVGLSGVDGTSTDSRVDVHRAFETISVLMGGDQVPAQFEARATRSNTFSPRESIPGGATLVTSLVELAAGREYVLFLKQLPAERGGGFGFWGEPGIAEVRDGRLIWKVTQEYRDDKRRAGKAITTDGVILAFDGATMADLVAAVAR